MTGASFHVGTISFAILAKTGIVRERLSRSLISGFWAARNHRVCRMTSAGTCLS